MNSISEDDLALETKKKEEKNLSSDEKSENSILTGDYSNWVPDSPTKKLREKPGKIANERQHGLNTLLAKRSSRVDLMNRFILKRDKHESKLEISSKSAKLGALLDKRPTKQRLQQLNVIKENDETTRNSIENKDSKASLTTTLNTKLSARPAKESLINSRIIQADDHEIELKIQKAKLQTKGKLDNFLAQRPAPETLINQKILADIGDLPSLEKREATINQLSPKLVESLKNYKVKLLRSGWGHTAIVDDKGDLYMFGLSDNGRLGLGEENKRELASHHPQLVRTLKQIGNISVVDCGDNHSAAIVHGKLYTWGMGSWGRLGVGNQLDCPTPTKVEIKGETPKDVVCGAYHTLTLTAHNKVYAFGWNKNGRLGLGADEKSLTVMTPREVKFENIKVVALGAGQNISLALDDKGLLYSWGAGVFGNLGHGDEKDCFEPKIIEKLKDKKVAHFAIGSQHALAVTEGGELFSWGLNKDRQLGRDDDKTNPYFPALVDFDAKGTTHLAAGKSHSTLVKGGLLFTWGKGASGALGHGDEKNVPVPTVVESLKSHKIDQVACGWNHTCVSTDKGEVFVFGGREHGKLGIP